MIVVKETKNGFEVLRGNPTLTSLDGEQRAPLRTILHGSWTEAERAAFGVHLVEPSAIPEGKRAAGEPSYARDRDGKVVEVRQLEDLPPVKVPPPSEAEVVLTQWAEGLGLTLADVRRVLSIGKLGQ